MISAFYLDVYTVTARRYLDCLGAGCTSSLVFGDTPLDQPLHNGTRNDAVTFCGWDGGRRLATDAELAKAARGPAPRRNLYPWGDTIDCTSSDFLVDCGWPAPASPYFGDDYDGLPGTRSYYGIDRLLAGGVEFTSDFFDPGFYTRAESRSPDPAGPTSGEYQVRGSDPRTAPTTVADRQSIDASPREPVASFRCARTVVVEVSP